MITSSPIPVAQLPSIFDAAKYILEKSPYTITQLELQKLLYLAQMQHLGEHEKPLFSARFEAWKFGPVNRALYEAINHYGSDSIPSSAIEGDASAIRCDTHKEVLDQIVSTLAGKTGTQLIRITHWEDGAWAKTFDLDFRYNQIPEPLMAEEYRKRKALIKQRVER